jgi:hypothetical protein
MMIKRIANILCSETPIYGTDPVTNYRVTATDVSHHISVMATVNKKLPAGSSWVMEVGHNGNGNVEVCLQSNVLGG